MIENILQRDVGRRTFPVTAVNPTTGRITAVTTRSLTDTLIKYGVAMRIDT